MRSIFVFFICFGSSVLMWLNTGSASLYGATLPHPMVATECNYVFNIDYYHFNAVHKLVTGAPKEDWQKSVILRRLLYPVVALPLTLTLGFVSGGVLFNFFLYWAALLYCWRLLSTRAPPSFVVPLFAIFATSPLFSYWIGSPFSYAAILPASLIAWTLAEKACNKNIEVLQLMLTCLAIGVLGLIHDSLAVFPMIAIAGALLLRGQVIRAINSAIVVAIPIIIAHVMTIGLVGRTLPYSNMVFYLALPLSYLSNIGDPKWLTQLSELPNSFLHTTFFALMVGIPALAFSLFLWKDWRRTNKPKGQSDRPKWLLSFAFVFLTLNLAPLYDTDFSLRGPSYARFYQFFFFPVLMWIASKLSEMTARKHEVTIASILLSLCVFFHLLVLTAPIGFRDLGEWIYMGFYDHTSLSQVPPGTYQRNLERFGVHPIGSHGCPWIVEEVHSEKLG